MKMEKMKSKMKWVFRPANKSTLNGRGNVNVEDLEIRPGGLLVQKRNSDSNKNSVPIPSIKVSVKYGSLNYQICISSQASFGELKKMLAEQTGVHPQDQKLIYKKKERDSKAYLDISGVKDGSKIMLIENITSWERRSLEMIKSAKIEKASKYLQQISLEVDKLHTKVKALEATASRGEKVAELDLDNLTGMLMNILVSLDGISAEGDLKFQKGMQERRVQKYIETLDMLKLRNSINNRTEDKIPKQQEENSTGKKPIPMQKLVQQQILRHSESFVITTNWETFD
ncbi:BAG family molecular chaperone regulator 1 [Hevea brasiliensis]|uniref:BAG family molecular chaperone regulator 1 n=1 Tax=Hevea brasiliensis TaxID=3981 RepID=UPI0025E30EF4|nr:BAG family molecular chaperone regulator 1 [Hevea brasiliensis]